MAKILSLRSQLNNQFWLKGNTEEELYLYVQVKAEKIKQEIERIPLNVSLVLDRSGSMHGEKLEYVKKATEFVIQNLNSEDYISIIQYDDTVDLVSPSQALKNKKQLLGKVSKIQSGGMTNLSGGMMEGYSQVKTTKKEGFVNRVLLLSDGLANVGVTDPSQLQAIASKHFREHGIGLSSFGVGSGFNELLMTGLAEHGGANYYFIETPDQIPQIFAEELDGLLSVVAQNTKLHITFPLEKVDCEKVYGYLHTLDKNTISVDFNDIFSEEEKAIVIKFKPKTKIQEPLEFFLTLTYDDVVDSLDKITEEALVYLQPTKDKAEQEAGLNLEATENAVLFVSNDWYEQAMKLVDAQNFDAAKQLLGKTKLYLEKYLLIFAKSEQLKKQYQQVQDYLQRLPSLKTMDQHNYSMAQKSSRMANYKLSKKKI